MSRNLDGDSQNQNQLPIGPNQQSSPFNISDIKMSQNFADAIEVKKVLNTIPVRKPDSQTYFRVHPDPAYHTPSMVLELREDRETFLVSKPLWADLATELIPKLLVTAVTRQGVIFIWPIRLPGADGKLDQWNRSAHDALRVAQGAWVRVVSNMALGAYELFKAPSITAEPAWPDVQFEDLLRIAFKDRYVDSVDHDVLKRLRGEL